MPSLGRTVPSIVSLLLAAVAARAEIIVQPGFASASSTACTDLNGNHRNDPGECSFSPPLDGDARSFDETASSGAASASAATPTAS